MAEDISELIPHRPPFLFVDRVVFASDIEVSTERKVNPDEPFFQGHYPGNPIMPGVLVCEAIFQTGAILISRLLKKPDAKKTGSGGIPILTRVKDVKFKNMVRPDDLLQVKVELVEKIGGAFFMKGVAKVDGKVVVRAEFAATITGGSG